jgi:hypothetical protein
VPTDGPDRDNTDAPPRRTPVIRGFEPRAFAAVTSAVGTFHVSPAVGTAPTMKVPVVSPAVVSPVVNLTAFRPGGGLVFRPVIGLKPFLRPGVPRSQLTVPVAPSADFQDEVLFEHPTDATKRYYLPRYRIAEQVVSGKNQFRIALAQGTDGGTLTVFLEKYAAPSIAAAAAQAQQLDHTISIKLSFQVRVGNAGAVQQEMDFQNVTAVQAGIQAVLMLDRLDQFTQVFAAMTDSQFQTVLTVRRNVNVAILVDRTADIQRLNGDIASLQAQIGATAAQIGQIRAQIAAFSPIPAMHVRLPALMAQLAQQSAALAAEQKQFQDKKKQISDIQANPLYRATPRAVDEAIPPQPWNFPRDLHGYIFAKAGTPGNAKFSLILRQVQWKGQSRSYYQNEAEPTVFYFLPDCFKIVRRPESPHLPMMSVRFPTPDAPVDTMPVTLEYVALPVSDPDRLFAAEQELKSHLPSPPNPGDRVVFQPLLADKVVLQLAIPRADSGSGPNQERTGAQVDLRNGIRDAVTLPMKDFQSLFDALFGSSAVLFSGQVVVDLGDGSDMPNESIPFAARMNDTVGEIFDYVESQDAASGGVQGTLTNAIESPIRITQLTANLHRGDAAVTGIIQGVSFSSPVDLGPGAKLTFVVAPSAPLPGGGPASAVFDLSKAAVIPDSESVWNAILDQSALPEYKRAVKVKTFAQMFKPTPDKPDDPILAIVVDFERGETVDLSADKLEIDATIRLSISDYVLKKLDAGVYQYKVAVIRASGQTRDGNWRTDRVGILFPDIKPIP